MTESIKIMVVDDTITYRMILKRVIEVVPGAEVVGTASNGKLALPKIASIMPDVVFLDVEMPEMDGLATLQQIKKQFPAITVVMVSGVSRSNANIVMECLNAGALDFVTKPQESNAERAFEALRTSLEPILAVVAKGLQRAAGPATSAPVATARSAPPPVAPPAPAPARRHPVASGGLKRKPELLLIGSSTGGPAALAKVLGGIKRPLGIPTLIVQHMPPVFTASLADQLSRSSGLHVKEARDGGEVEPGQVVIAMGGRHMTAAERGGKLAVALNDGAKVNECRPAVDVLFMSVMAGFSGYILTVILTGMGRDGANGVDALKRTGKAYCITQDKNSCVVYGMPRAVDELGLSDESLPLDEIGPRIAELCS